MSKKRRFKGRLIEDSNNIVKALCLYIDISFRKNYSRKKVQAYLKEINFSLSSEENTVYPTYPKLKLKGSAILERADLAQFHERVEDQNLTYVLTKEVWRPVNHKNRMKTIWNKSNNKDLSYRINLLQEYVRNVMGVVDGGARLENMRDSFIQIQVLKTVGLTTMEIQKGKMQKEKKGGKKQRRKQSAF